MDIIGQVWQNVAFLQHFEVLIMLVQIPDLHVYKCAIVRFNFNVENFVARWFAQKADKLGDRFESKKSSLTRKVIQ